MFDEVMFWLETAWWALVALLLLGGLYASISNRLGRRRGQTFGDMMRRRWLDYLAEKREAEFRELRRQDRKRRAKMISDDRS